jgi:hypothetical protein
MPRSRNLTGIAALAAFSLCLGAGVAAHSGIAFAQPAPPPPKLEPLPEIPPPPELATDPDLEPQVTITRKDGETVEEARVGGRVVWIKVTPRLGRPYFLVPDSSARGAMIRFYQSGPRPTSRPQQRSLAGAMPSPVRG